MLVITRSGKYDHMMDSVGDYKVLGNHGDDTRQEQMIFSMKRW